MNVTVSRPDEKFETNMTPALELRDVAKSFTMHLQGGVRLAVVAGVTFSVRGGECIARSFRKRAATFAGS